MPAAAGAQRRAGKGATSHMHPRVHALLFCSTLPVRPQKKGEMVVGLQLILRVWGRKQHDAVCRLAAVQMRSRGCDLHPWRVPAMPLPTKNTAHPPPTSPPIKSPHPTHPPTPPPVDVLLHVWREVVIDDKGQVPDVQASSSNIRRHQHLRAAGREQAASAEGGGVSTE